MKKIIIFTGLLFLQACAFTDATLDVRHSDSADVTGPISEPEQLQFTQPAMSDARTDQLRIGWKKNGYGANTANITTEMPVEEIVEAALVEAINDNGHNIMADGLISITGTVDRFWFDFKSNFWSVEFMGDIQCTLAFTDTETSETFYESSYHGSYKKKTGGGLEKTWAEVMSKAMDVLIEEIVYDEDLAEALTEWKESISDTPAAP